MPPLLEKPLSTLCLTPNFFSDIFIFPRVQSSALFMIWKSNCKSKCNQFITYVPIDSYSLTTDMIWGQLSILRFHVLIIDISVIRRSCIRTVRLSSSSRIQFVPRATSCPEFTGLARKHYTQPRIIFSDRNWHIHAECGLFKQFWVYILWSNDIKWSFGDQTAREITRFLDIFCPI